MTHAPCYHARCCIGQADFAQLVTIGYAIPAADSVDGCDKAIVYERSTGATVSVPVHVLPVARYAISLVDQYNECIGEAI